MSNIKITAQLITCLVFALNLSITSAINSDEDLVFPTDSTLVGSTFGPRRLNDNFDFHRGLDIFGTTDNRIFSMADGVVFSASSESGSVQIEHTNLVSSNGGPVYSRYSHLASVDVERGDTVEAGQDIGGMGNTNAVLVHLHFEVREDTPFSLAFQLDNGGCRTDPCKDPHVHPFNYIGADDNKGPAIEVISQDDEPLRVRASVSANELDINRFEVRSPGNELIVIDYNTRQGFDASSNGNLDKNPINSGPEFEVFSFTRNSAERGDDFIVEIEFSEVIEYSSIRAFDTYGNVTEVSNGDDDFLLQLIPSIIGKKKR